MAKKRAPNCPSLSLPDAIEKAECVYSIEGRSTFDGESAVRHIGYTGLNGASRRALGALRSFGLIIGRGEDLRISEDAIVIIADAQSSDQSERQTSLLRALRFNRVFADLAESFGPGSTLLKITAYLQKHYEFKTSAARRTAKMYKDSVAIVQWGGTHSTGEPTARPEIPDSMLESVVDAVLPAATQAGATDSSSDKFPQESATVPSQGQNASLNRQESFAIDEGLIKLECPKRMSDESFEDFTDWLLIMHRRIGREVSSESKAVLKKVSDS